ncbi:lyase family protein [Herbiconiux sp. P15]|uniref:lyase family protein n=1 Tax=Herbiconiux liukaitaii TaxID=3342799 RepID=UPI0035B82A9D
MSGAVDRGLLSPLTVGHDGLVSDGAVVDALVTAELALVRAWAAVGALPSVEAETIAAAWGWDAELHRAHSHGIDAGDLAEAGVAGGNPVIPLVSFLKQRVEAEQRAWVHRGATSQDIVDTALMLVARGAVDTILVELEAAETALAAFAAEHRDVVAAGRTLTAHAVPTTVGLRAVGWLGGLRRASARLRQLTLPAQLGGAAGTRASFVELGGAAASALPTRFAEAAGLASVEEVWHTSRWPVTELGDALTQTTDALGKFAGDVTTLSRTEIAELGSGAGGASSTMPQKSNPVQAVLIRSAALRAPQLAATLHVCAALAVDERPDGAWHAEWPTLRELLRLALGASAHGAQLARALRVDREAVARTLGLTRGLILAERVSLVLTPLIGTDRVRALVARAAAGEDLAALLTALPEAAPLDLPALLDPTHYLGDALTRVDRATTPAPAPDSEGEAS